MYRIKCDQHKQTVIILILMYTIFNVIKIQSNSVHVERVAIVGPDAKVQDVQKNTP